MINFKSAKAIAVLAGLFCLPFGASASEATMSLSSANAVYQAGKSFTARIVINSGGGAGINASEGRLAFNPKEIKVSKIVKEGSIFDIWPKPPVFDNAKGTIDFAGGTTKGFKDTAGVVLKITFTPLVRGDVKISMATTSCAVMAGDGMGQNILKETDEGDYTFGSLSTVQNAETLRSKMVGRILLQVERSGRSWYVYPGDRMRYFLGRPVDAFNLMRKLGLGVNHAYVSSYLDGAFPAKMAGRILLDVEDSGKAYYIYPVDRKAYYLGRPKDAFQIMRQLGLGISNTAIKKIPDWAI
jgi:hypothetical protein